MSGDLKADNPFADRLNEAIDRLHKDVQRVEIWAGALTGYARPPAQYEVDERHKLTPANDTESTANAGPMTRSMNRSEAAE
ncbi:hypothetical protein GJW-30_1_00704 [Variibacter gotjawalensis]|uniref:Uncharacterized protein n=1 Tax=Variibacter gotjawalensis TaxID=1333996 RepID=A0A0S3PQH1_9BRAD|nr:hypothetical protein [Variibacter gotjawalensis]NIK48483.1 hypothetical protein [Variibacter gotjawalensis]RZS50350.1 hypothetical protein EV661_2812 [Variibacter gotjawalensis]BAT58183.1 hypothetical protein GJW-30_1_00704 [Variibacter gotjawalensis]